MAVKGEIIRTFELYGMALRGDAASYLCELLEPLPRGEHQQWVEAVVEQVQKLPLTATQITREAIHKAAQEVGESENYDPEAILQVIDIFKVPKLNYDVDKKKFHVETSQNLSLHGGPTDKASLFRNRYTVVHQRTINHPLFKRPVIGGTSAAAKTYTLKKVEFLLGSSCRRLDGLVVLGMLTQLVEGKYHLEDDTGHIQLSLTDTKFHKGLFTQNCFVLVEGWYEDNLLHAEAIGLPPPEPASLSRELLGMDNVNYFGGPGRRCVKGNSRLIHIEQENTEAMFVVLSDVWLDIEKVMQKLQVLFAGYANFPPTAFILCGNFFSVTHGPRQLKEARDAFEALGKLIARHPELVAHSRFIFVPGPNDMGPSTIFPRPKLPQCLTEGLSKALPNACLATNPCRLVYCTQEIVVFREDIVTKMCRNAVYFPADSDNIHTHFAKTLVNQGHLAPLPLQVVPVYWPLDHCLAIHPTPDVIITADKGNTFNATHNDAIVFNPGSFCKTDFSFKVYIPATRQVEDSQIKEEES